MHIMHRIVSLRKALSTHLSPPPAFFELDFVMSVKRRVKITKIGFCHLWLTEKHSLIFVKHKFIETAPKNALIFAKILENA